MSTRICRFLPLISLPASNPCGSMQAPLFGAFHALAIDDASGGAGLPFHFLAAFDVQCMMDAIKRAVAMPPRKIVMQRAARRKVFWNIAPLAAGAQDIHDAVHDRAHVRSPLAAAAFSGRNQRLDMRPFRIRQIARISQVIAVVLRSVLVRPHGGPSSNQRRPHRITSDSNESRSLRTDTKVRYAEANTG